MEQTLGRALAVLIQYALFLVEGAAVLLSTRLALAPVEVRRRALPKG